jgi:hypothetical protein
MNTAANIACYSTLLLESKPEHSESAFSRVADRFEDDLLEFDEFPPEYFAFVLTLLSDRRFYLRKGLWNFLLVLGTEMRRLSDDDCTKLTKVIEDNYPSYENEDLCLGVCDLVSRNFETKSAFDLLNRLKRLEATKPANLRGFADEGLTILEREVARSMKSQH